MVRRKFPKTITINYKFTILLMSANTIKARGETTKKSLAKSKRKSSKAWLPFHLKY